MKYKPLHMIHISAAQGSPSRGAVVGSGRGAEPQAVPGLQQNSLQGRNSGFLTRMLWALRELQGGAGGAGEMEIQGEMKGLVLLKFSPFVVFVL